MEITVIITYQGKLKFNFSNFMIKDMTIIRSCTGLHFFMAGCWATVLDKLESCMAYPALIETKLL